MEKYFQHMLQEYQDVIITSFTSEHNEEITLLKYYHEQEVRYIRESCTQQVIEQSRKSTLVEEILIRIREKVLVVNQVLYNFQALVFTQLEEVCIQYQELEALRDQVEIQEEFVVVGTSALE